jgi:hypothetical protein
LAVSSPTPFPAARGGFGLIAGPSAPFPARMF